MMTQEQMREEFEAWASTKTKTLKRLAFPLAASIYEDGYTQAAWEAWQAARATQPAPVVGEDVSDLLQQLNGLLSMTCESYKTLARDYAPGLADVIERLASTANKEPK